MSVLKAFAFGVVAVTALSFAGEASADGGTAEVNTSYDGQVYNRDVTRQGPHGGSYNRSTTCDKATGNCSSNSNATGPAGYAASKSATRSRSGGTVSRSATGPGGGSVTRTRTWCR